MSAREPPISYFLATTEKKGLDKYIEAEQITKRALDDATAAYHKCISDRDSYVTQHTKATLEQDKNKREELKRLITEVNRAKIALTHAEESHTRALNTKTKLQEAADVEANFERAKAQALRNRQQLQQRDSGAGVGPMMSPVVPDRDVPVVVSGPSQRPMVMAVQSQPNDPPAQRSPSPRGCWWCGKSKKRGTSPPKSATAGGRKSRIRKLKTKRTYKKRRTARK